MLLLTKEDNHERKSSRVLDIFTAVCAATAFACVFLSNSVVYAAWEEPQGTLTEMRLKRKRKIDNIMSVIREKKNKQTTRYTTARV